MKRNLRASWAFARRIAALRYDALMTKPCALYKNT